MTELTTAELYTVLNIENYSLLPTAKLMILYSIGKTGLTSWDDSHPLYSLAEQIVSHIEEELKNRVQHLH